MDTDYYLKDADYYLKVAKAKLDAKLEAWPIEDENPQTIAAQNALDLVETALYWLEAYEEEKETAAILADSETMAAIAEAENEV